MATSLEVLWNLRPCKRITWRFSGACFATPLPNRVEFYRIGLSGHRGELALWDSLGEFLQLVPCAVEIGKLHRLEIVCHGARFVVTLDGKQVLDYVDRSLPHAGGQVGLAVWRSKVSVSRFDVTRIAPDPAPVTAHRPDFHFEQDGPTAILFDGHEPISRFFKSTGGGSGALFQNCVKLQPGGRTVYYTWLGPAITPGPEHGVLPLVGDAGECTGNPPASRLISVAGPENSGSCRSAGCPVCAGPWATAGEATGESQMRNVPSFLAAVSLVCGVAHVAGAAEPIVIPEVYDPSPRSRSPKPSSSNNTTSRSSSLTSSRYPRACSRR
ncbi:MAG: hypothetical protein ABIP48_16400 [Planctomycetota bacterium]